MPNANAAKNKTVYNRRGQVNGSIYGGVCKASVFEMHVNMQSVCTERERERGGEIERETRGRTHSFFPKIENNGVLFAGLACCCCCCGHCHYTHCRREGSITEISLRQSCCFLGDREREREREKVYFYITHKHTHMYIIYSIHTHTRAEGTKSCKMHPHTAAHTYYLSSWLSRLPSRAAIAPSNHLRNPAVLRLQHNTRYYTHNEPIQEGPCMHGVNATLLLSGDGSLLGEGWLLWAAVSMEPCDAGSTESISTDFPADPLLFSVSSRITESSGELLVLC